MRKILKNNKKTRDYLNSLPTMSIVFKAASYGVITVPFTGKYTKDNTPLIYDYYDANGECDIYVLRPIDHVTSFAILCWVNSRATAERIANAFNQVENNSKNN